MHFAKMHGIGNDYVVLDARQAADQGRDWTDAARALCDRRFGVGSDGLLLVMPSKEADFRMRMFNPDGSEAEMCGNGIRCFSKYVADKGLVGSSVDSFMVETLAGIKRIKLFREDGLVSIVQVGMGAPRLKPEEVPVALPQGEGAGPDVLVDYPVTIGNREFKVTCVSMGNPHAVAYIEEPVTEFPLEDFGPKMENYPLYPRRVNFEVVNIVSPQHLRMRVWERGAGETLACGTGACAVAVSSRLHGFTGDKVDITLPGGTLTVAWDGKGEVQLTGPAELVFEGEWLGKIRF